MSLLGFLGSGGLGALRKLVVFRAGHERFNGHEVLSERQQVPPASILLRNHARPGAVTVNSARHVSGRLSPTFR